MKSKFCPSCGRETEDLYSGLCKACFLKKTSILEVSPIVESAFCKSCGRIFSGKEWKYYDSAEEALKDIVTQSATILPGATISLEFKGQESIGNATIPVSVAAEAEVEGKKVSATKKTEVMFRQRTCDVCGKRKGGYYETVLQIRAADAEELLSFVQKRIGELFSTDKSSYITKIEEKKGGFDIYVGGKSAARKIAGEAKRIYSLETKKTYKQSGAKGGKSLYRETILLRGTVDSKGAI